MSSRDKPPWYPVGHSERGTGVTHQYQTRATTSSSGAATSSGTAPSQRSNTGAMASYASVAATPSSNTFRGSASNLSSRPGSPSRNSTYDSTRPASERNVYELNGNTANVRERIAPNPPRSSTHASVPPLNMTPAQLGTYGSTLSPSCDKGAPASDKVIYWLAESCVRVPEQIRVVGEGAYFGEINGRWISKESKAEMNLISPESHSVRLWKVTINKKNIPSNNHDYKYAVCRYRHKGTVDTVKAYILGQEQQPVWSLEAGAPNVSNRRIYLNAMFPWEISSGTKVFHVYDVLGERLSNPRLPSPVETTQCTRELLAQQLRASANDPSNSKVWLAWYVVVALQNPECRHLNVSIYDVEQDILSHTLLLSLSCQTATETLNFLQRCHNHLQKKIIEVLLRNIQSYEQIVFSTPDEEVYTVARVGKGCVVPDGLLNWAFHKGCLNIALSSFPIIPSFSKSPLNLESPLELATIILQSVTGHFAELNDLLGEYKSFVSSERCTNHDDRLGYEMLSVIENVGDRAAKCMLASIVGRVASGINSFVKALAILIPCQEERNSRELIDAVVNRAVFLYHDLARTGDSKGAFIFTMACAAGVHVQTLGNHDSSAFLNIISCIWGKCIIDAGTNLENLLDDMTDCIKERSNARELTGTSFVLLHMIHRIIQAGEEIEITVWIKYLCDLEHHLIIKGLEFPPFEFVNNLGDMLAKELVHSFNKDHAHHSQAPEQVWFLLSNLFYDSNSRNFSTIFQNSLKGQLRRYPEVVNALTLTVEKLTEPIAGLFCHNSELLRFYCDMLETYCNSVVTGIGHSSVFQRIGVLLPGASMPTDPVPLQVDKSLQLAFRSQQDYLPRNSRTFRAKFIHHVYYSLISPLIQPYMDEDYQETFDEREESSVWTNKPKILLVSKNPKVTVCLIIASFICTKFYVPQNEILHKLLEEIQELGADLVRLQLSVKDVMYLGRSGHGHRCLSVLNLFAMRHDLSEFQTAYESVITTSTAIGRLQEIPQNLETEVETAQEFNLQHSSLQAIRDSLSSLAVTLGCRNGFEYLSAKHFQTDRDDPDDETLLNHHIPALGDTERDCLYFMRVVTQFLRLLRKSSCTVVCSIFRANVSAFHQQQESECRQQQKGKTEKFFSANAEEDNLGNDQGAPQETSATESLIVHLSWSQLMGIASTCVSQLSLLLNPKSLKDVAKTFLQSHFSQVTIDSLDDEARLWHEICSMWYRGSRYATNTDEARKLLTTALKVLQKDEFIFLAKRMAQMLNIPISNGSSAAMSLLLGESDDQAQTATIDGRAAPRPNSSNFPDINQNWSTLGELNQASEGDEVFEAALTLTGDQGEYVWRLVLYILGTEFRHDIYKLAKELTDESFQMMIENYDNQWTSISVADIEATKRMAANIRQIIAKADESSCLADFCHDARKFCQEIKMNAEDVDRIRRLSRPLLACHREMLNESVRVRNVGRHISQRSAWTFRISYKGVTTEVSYFNEKTNQGEVLHDQELESLHTRANIMHADVVHNLPLNEAAEESEEELGIETFLEILHQASAVTELLWSLYHAGHLCVTPGKTFEAKVQQASPDNSLEELRDALKVQHDNLIEGIDSLLAHHISLTMIPTCKFAKLYALTADAQKDGMPPIQAAELFKAMAPNVNIPAPVSMGNNLYHDVLMSPKIESKNLKLVTCNEMICLLDALGEIWDLQLNATVVRMRPPPFDEFSVDYGKNRRNALKRKQLENQQKALPDILPRSTEIILAGAGDIIRTVVSINAWHGEVPNPTTYFQCYENSRFEDIRSCLYRALHLAEERRRNVPCANSVKGPIVTLVHGERLPLSVIRETTALLKQWKSNTSISTKAPFRIVILIQEDKKNCVQSTAWKSGLDTAASKRPRLSLAEDASGVSKYGKFLRELSKSGGCPAKNVSIVSSSRAGSGKTTYIFQKVPFCNHELSQAQQQHIIGACTSLSDIVGLIDQSSEQFEETIKFLPTDIPRAIRLELHPFGENVDPDCLLFELFFLGGVYDPTTRHQASWLHRSSSHLNVNIYCEVANSLLCPSGEELLFDQSLLLQCFPQHDKIEAKLGDFDPGISIAVQKEARLVGSALELMRTESFESNLDQFISIGEKAEDVEVRTEDEGGLSNREVAQNIITFVETTELYRKYGEGVSFHVIRTFLRCAYRNLSHFFASPIFVLLGDYAGVAHTKAVIVRSILAAEAETVGSMTGSRQQKIHRNEEDQMDSDNVNLGIDLENRTSDMQSLRDKSLLFTLWLPWNPGLMHPLPTDAAAMPDSLGQILQENHEAFRQVYDDTNATRFMFDPSKGLDTIVDGLGTILDEYVQFLFSEVEPDPSNIPSWVKNSYAFTPDNFKKFCLLGNRLLSGSSAVMLGASGCGKTLLIQTFAELSGGMHFSKLSINAGTTFKDINQFFKSMNDLVVRTGQRVIALFDEINTSSLLPLFKNILVDRVWDGKTIDSRILTIGAANPYETRSRDEHGNFQGTHTTGLSYQTTEGRIDESGHAIRGLRYDVLPLPEALFDITFNFGKLSSDETSTYIDRMLSQNALVKCDPEMFNTVATALKTAYNFVSREPENDVSLRDVNRFLKFFEWLHKFGRHVRGNTLMSILVATHLTFELQFSSTDLRQHMRMVICNKVLGRQDPWVHKHMSSGRRAFSFFPVGWNLPKYWRMAVEGEQDAWMRFLCLPKHIAPHRGFLDNIFALVACTLNLMPVILVGVPGCSKSLSVSRVVSRLSSNADDDYRQMNLPNLYQFVFQGSEQSTSKGIENAFDEAIQRQKELRKHAPGHLSLVQLDELGLAERSRDNCVRVLHARLEPDLPAGKEDEIKTRSITNLHPDDPRVAVVGISNWKLDVAKISRFVVVNCRTQNEEDMLITAERTLEGVLTPTTQRCIFTVVKQYNRLIQGAQSPPQFHGLRDLYGVYQSTRRYFECARSIRRGEIDELIGREHDRLLVEQIQYIQERLPEIHGVNQETADFLWCLELAIRQNFSGNESFIDENSKSLCEQLVDAAYSRFMGIPSLSQQLTDTSERLASVNECVRQNLADAQARHLMLFTDAPSYVSSAVAELARKTGRIPYVLIGSKLPEDINSLLYAEKVLRQILFVMAQTNRVLIMYGLENVYASLYDVFNANYYEMGCKRFCRVALGEVCTNKAEVGSGFKAVVVCDKRMANTPDKALLNRFAKYEMMSTELLRQNELANHVMETIVRNKGESLNKENFPGFSLITLRSTCLLSAKQDQTNRSQIVNRINSWMEKIRPINRCLKDRKALKALRITSLSFEECLSEVLQETLTELSNAPNITSALVIPMTILSSAQIDDAMVNKEHRLLQQIESSAGNRCVTQEIAADVSAVGNERDITDILYRDFSQAINRAATAGTFVLRLHVNASLPESRNVLLLVRHRLQAYVSDLCEKIAENPTECHRRDGTRDGGNRHLRTCVFVVMVLHAQEMGKSEDELSWGAPPGTFAQNGNVLQASWKHRYLEQLVKTTPWGLPVKDFLFSRTRLNAIKSKEQIGEDEYFCCVAGLRALVHNQWIYILNNIAAANHGRTQSMRKTNERLQKYAWVFTVSDQFVKALCQCMIEKSTGDIRGGENAWTSPNWLAEVDTNTDLGLTWIQLLSSDLRKTLVKSISEVFTKIDACGAINSLVIAEQTKDAARLNLWYICTCQERLWTLPTKIADYDVNFPDSKLLYLEEHFPYGASQIQWCLRLVQCLKYTQDEDIIITKLPQLLEAERGPWWNGVLESLPKQDLESFLRTRTQDKNRKALGSFPILHDLIGVLHNSMNFSTALEKHLTWYLTSASLKLVANNYFLSNSDIDFAALLVLCQSRWNDVCNYALTLSDAISLLLGLHGFDSLTSLELAEQLISQVESNSAEPAVKVAEVTIKLALKSCSTSAAPNTSRQDSLGDRYHCMKEISRFTFAYAKDEHNTIAYALQLLLTMMGKIRNAQTPCENLDTFFNAGCKYLYQSYSFPQSLSQIVTHLCKLVIGSTVSSQTAVDCCSESIAELLELLDFEESLPTEDSFAFEIAASGCDYLRQASEEEKFMWVNSGEFGTYSVFVRHVVWLLRKECDISECISSNMALTKRLRNVCSRWTSPPELIDELLQQLTALLDSEANIHGHCDTYAHALLSDSFLQCFHAQPFCQYIRKIANDKNLLRNFSTIKRVRLSLTDMIRGIDEDQTNNSQVTSVFLRSALRSVVHTMAHWLNCSLSVAPEALEAEEVITELDCLATTALPGMTCSPTVWSLTGDNASEITLHGPLILFVLRDWVALSDMQVVMDVMRNKFGQFANDFPGLRRILDLVLTRTKIHPYLGLNPFKTNQNFDNSMKELSSSCIQRVRAIADREDNPSNATDTDQVSEVDDVIRTNVRSLDSTTAFLQITQIILGNIQLSTWGTEEGDIPPEAIETGRNSLMEFLRGICDHVWFPWLHGCFTRLRPVCTENLDVPSLWRNVSSISVQRVLMLSHTKCTPSLALPTAVMNLPPDIWGRFFLPGSAQNKYSSWRNHADDITGIAVYECRNGGCMYRYPIYNCTQPATLSTCKWCKGTIGGQSHRPAANQHRLIGKESICCQQFADFDPDAADSGLQLCFPVEYLSSEEATFFCQRWKPRRCRGHNKKEVAILNLMLFEIIQEARALSATSLNDETTLKNILRSPNVHAFPATPTGEEACGLTIEALFAACLEGARSHVESLFQLPNRMALYKMVCAIMSDWIEQAEREQQMFNAADNITGTFSSDENRSQWEKMWLNRIGCHYVQNPLHCIRHFEEARSPVEETDDEQKRPRKAIKQLMRHQGLQLDTVIQMTNADRQLLNPLSLRSAKLIDIGIAADEELRRSPDYRILWDLKFNPEGTTLAYLSSSLLAAILRWTNIVTGHVHQKMCLLDIWSTSVDNFLEALPPEKNEEARHAFRLAKQAWKCCRDLKVVRNFDCDRGDIPILDEESPLALSVVHEKTERPSDTVFENENRQCIPLQGIPEDALNARNVTVNSFFVLYALAKAHNDSLEYLDDYTSTSNCSHLEQRPKREIVHLSNLQGLTLRKFGTMNFVDYIEHRTEGDTFGIGIREIGRLFSNIAPNPSSTSVSVDLEAFEKIVFEKHFPLLPKIDLKGAGNTPESTDVPQVTLLETTYGVDWNSLEKVISQEETIEEQSANSIQDLFEHTPWLARETLSLIPAIANLITKTGGFHSSASSSIERFCYAISNESARSSQSSHSSSVDVLACREVMGLGINKLLPLHRIACDQVSKDLPGELLSLLPSIYRASMEEEVYQQVRKHLDSLVCMAQRNTNNSSDISRFTPLEEVVKALGRFIMHALVCRQSVAANETVQDVSSMLNEDFLTENASQFWDGNYKREVIEWSNTYAMDLFPPCQVLVAHCGPLFKEYHDAMQRCKASSSEAHRPFAAAAGNLKFPEELALDFGFTAGSTCVDNIYRQDENALRYRQSGLTDFDEEDIPEEEEDSPRPHQEFHDDGEDL